MKAVSTVAIMAALALGCDEPVDPAYRREVTMICEAPIFGYGNLRLASKRGRTLQKIINDAPQGRRPALTWQAARGIGMKQCGALPAWVADFGELPAAGRQRDLMIEAYDEAKAPVRLGADATWAELTAAPGEVVRFAVADGMQLGMIELHREVEPPPSSDLRVLITLTREQLAVYAETEVPRLVIAPDAEGREERIEGLLAALDELRTEAVRYGSASHGDDQIRVQIAPDVTLRSAAPILGLLRPRAGPSERRIMLVAGAPSTVTRTETVRLIHAGIFANVPSQRAHDALRDEVAARFEREYLPRVAACRESSPESTAAAGTIILELAVLLESGEVRADPEVRGFGDPELDGCVRRAIVGRRFPPLPGTYSATFVVGFGL